MVNNEEKFWAKVEKSDGCWAWKGCIVNGYGYFNYGRFMRAHRLSWQFANNSVIPDGMCVLHSCDNKWCVNPEHLSLGSQRDNMHDMSRKGRSLFGEKNARAKLTANDVLEIKKMCTEKAHTQKAIGEMFGVRYETINKIYSGIYRKHG